MKKLFATLVAISIVSAASPVAAATYPSSVSYSNGWVVSWTVVQPGCKFPTILQDTVLIIDGVSYHPGYIMGQDPSPTIKSLNFFGGIPDGQLESITVSGESFIECGGDIYFLPGYVAPPAPVPTLSEWAMILLGVMLAGGAALTIQRRRQAA